MQYAKHFIPLESDPSIFTSFLHRLGGAPTLQFIDIWSLDDPDQLAAIPQPVLAFVLVLPAAGDYEQIKGEKASTQVAYEEGPDIKNIVWFKQTIHNACGLYGLLHAICNTQAEGSIRTEQHPFLDDLTNSTNTTPATRTHLLETSNFLEDAYDIAAKNGSSTVPDAEDEVDFHYVCFAKGQDGRSLYELDGDMKGPIRRSSLSDHRESSLFEKGLEAVKEYIRDSGMDANFSLMALVEMK
ncbi:MAG: hypothetical protein Q9168_003891 [Polycauliona sp. 1 TL-2023]